MARTVEAAFSELLARETLTTTQVAGAKLRINHLTTFLAKTFYLDAPPLLTGSFVRGTLCASERDIDVLVPFSNLRYWSRYSANSSSFLYWVRDYLNEHYQTSHVSSKQVAVRLDFVTFATEVTPAFVRPAGGYAIPDGKGGWLATNPPYHEELMQVWEIIHAFRLKSLVRLLKIWNLANSRRLSSFHIELLVRQIWENKAIPDWPEAVATTLNLLPIWLALPFRDPWSDGGYVDSYLSSEARRRLLTFVEEEKQRASDAEVYRKLGSIDKAFERWNLVYFRTFPAYG